MNLQKNIRSDAGRLLLFVLPHHRWLGQAHGACYTANIQTELLLWPGRLWLSSGSISVCWCCNSSQIHSPSLSNPYNSVVYLCINAWRWIGYSSQLRPIFLFCPRARFFPFTPFVQAGGRGASPPPLYHSSCSLPKCLYQQIWYVYVLHDENSISKKQIINLFLYTSLTLIYMIVCATVYGIRIQNLKGYPPPWTMFFLKWSFS